MRNAKYFSIMIDETADISRLEQVNKDKLLRNYKQQKYFVVFMRLRRQMLKYY